MLQESNKIFNFEQGEVLLVDKPLNWTSFDVVNKLRYASKVKKIGHAGTLDPLATGLLVLCTGKFTKKIEEYQAQEKEYIGSLFLGATTATYDSETEPEQIFDISHITPAQVLDITSQFIGHIKQLPPMYSAIKVNGKRLYELARKGKEVELKPRAVYVSSFELTKIDLPNIEFKVVCSKGTYIRSLAHDLGKALGVGAYLTSLRRTRIGDFSVNDAKSVEEWVALMNQQRVLGK
jgi:tRNA pseudouridine55 synthase